MQAHPLAPTREHPLFKVVHVVTVLSAPPPPFGIGLTLVGCYSVLSAHDVSASFSSIVCMPCSYLQNLQTRLNTACKYYWYYPPIVVRTREPLSSTPLTDCNHSGTIVIKQLTRSLAYPSACVSILQLTNCIKVSGWLVR